MWNGKICNLLKYFHLDLFYVIDYSGSFDIHIEKLYKKLFLFSGMSAKKRFGKNFGLFYAFSKDPLEARK